MSVVDAIIGAGHAPLHDLENGTGSGRATPMSLDHMPRDGGSSPAPASYPMTATASSASDHPVQDIDDATLASYGTRSRHRPGARPNYAEDKDIDMEIEAAGRLSKSSSKKPPTKSYDQQSDGEVSAVRGGGFAAINSNAATTTATAPVPGTSSFAAQASQASVTQPSKKRKQPGSNTTVSGATTTSQTKTRHPTTAVRRLETNMMTFERSGAKLNARKQLVADDGTALSANDHVYMVCEPPGEPYYLARIMEFLHADNEPNGRVDAMRVNWYYRPKDIQRRVQDTRVVFASMHSDCCPLTSLRGTCNIQHLSEIAYLDQYRVQKDHFWFDKLYDRYMHRYYEVIPTGKVINVPQHVKKVLDDRWKFVLFEIGRGRELTSAVKTCKRCSQYAANHDSVDCAVCKNTYHMQCIRPPLLKKPARGFAWACAACSRAQELRLETRNTPTLTDGGLTGDEALEEEDDDLIARQQQTRESSLGAESHPLPTAAQIAQANLWPWRYLGVHCRVEDALDYDDRIYPRASSRLGPRHQANVTTWHGRPVQLVKPADIKRKYLKNTTHKKDVKLSKDALAALESERDNKLKRPKWVVDEPIGYVHRGEDKPVEIKGKQEYTAQLTFKMPDASQLPARGGDETDFTLPENREKLVDEFMTKAKAIAPQYGIEGVSVDFLTKAIEKLQETGYDVDKALTALKSLSSRSDLKLPELNREELKRFEEGVSMYGSELHNVARHVGSTVKESRIVRFYYMWKKTERGREVWGGYEGRKSKKESKRIEKEGSGVKLLDDVANDHDDSAFDNDKAYEKKRGFECKFCSTRKSRQWRRAPGTAPGTWIPADAAAKTSKDKSNWLTLALCGKCAYLWRRYAIQYESIEEVSRKIAAAGGRAAKRKVDEELMRTIVEAQHESGDTISTGTAAAAASAGVVVPQDMIETAEPPKKKAKPDTDVVQQPEVVAEKKKAATEKEPEPTPLVPEMPRVKVHPCAVCHLIELPGDELLKCRDCRLHVHRSCYGVRMDANVKPWFCDMCHNDHNTQVSTTYECVLCPVKYTPQELMEPLRVSHKKKTDREREKERLEREMVQEASRRWRQEQEGAGRPVNPREALKTTAWNNWVHVICAMWTEEIKFGNAELYDAAEGVGFIPQEHYKVPCKICKTLDKKPTFNCFHKGCDVHFHIGCAHQAEYFFGFDIFVPKGTRREAKPMMRLEGEQGSEYGHATAVILCNHHIPERLVHSMLEATDDGITALQLFARLYKQVDQSVTGTVRRAGQFAQTPSSNSLPNGTGIRQNSTVNGVTPAQITQAEKLNRRILTSPAGSPTAMEELHAEPETIAESKRSMKTEATSNKKCCTCSIDVSPRWHIVRNATVLNGYHRPDHSQGRNHGLSINPGGQQRNGTSPRAFQPRFDMTSQADGLLTNGVVKVEGSPELQVADPVSTSSEHIVYQCHKCYKQKIPPPSSSPRYRQPRPVFNTEAIGPEPLFRRASLSRPEPSPVLAPSSSSAWQPVRAEAHPHGSGPASATSGTYPWATSYANPPYPRHPPSWASTAPRSSAGPAPPSYHQPGSLPDYYSRTPFTPHYATAPLASPRPVLTGGPQHQSPSSSYSFPHTHSHGLPPPPPALGPFGGPHDRYAPSHQALASPQHHQNAPPPPPSTRPSYGGPPPPMEFQSHSHSKDFTSGSPQQHRTYSTVPPPQAPRNSESQSVPMVGAGSAHNTPTVSRSSMGLDLSRIAQSASEQMNTGEVLGYNSSTGGHIQSPTAVRPATPAAHQPDRDRHDESAHSDGAGHRAMRGMSVGASASPSLKHLLS